LDLVEEAELVDNLADGLQERRKSNDGDFEGLLVVTCLETATSIPLGRGDLLDWSC